MLYNSTDLVLECFKSIKNFRIIIVDNGKNEKILKKIENDFNIEKIIISKKFGTKSEIEKIDKKVKAIITECEEFAESSPFPDKSLMYDVVYEQKDYPFIKHKID